jgi:hypothetical protein
MELTQEMKGILETLGRDAQIAQRKIDSFVRLCGMALNVDFTTHGFDPKTMSFVERPKQEKPAQLREVQ